MKRAFSAIALLMLIGCQPQPLGEYLEQFLWKHPLVIVFIPDADDPSVRQQTEYLTAARPVLAQKQVRVFEVEYLRSVKQDGALQPNLPASRFYEYFQIETDAFAVILIGLDGNEVLRSTEPLTVDALVSLRETAIPAESR